MKGAVQTDQVTTPVAIPRTPALKVNLSFVKAPRLSDLMHTEVELNNSQITSSLLVESLAAWGCECHCLVCYFARAAVNTPTIKTG